MFLSSRGIIYQTLVPHTLQQNSHAKRFNQTLLEKAKAIWQHACLPRSFWQDTVETALHIYNQQPIYCHQQKTLIEMFNGDKPDVSYFRIFGSHAYMFIPPKQWQDKLSPKAEEMVFIGYEPNIKGYCFWLTAWHRVFISTHALFDEMVFSFCSRNQTDGPVPKQHMTNLLQRKLKGIWNPFETTIYKFLSVSTTPVKIHQMLGMHLIILDYPPHPILHGDHFWKMS